MNQKKMEQFTLTHDYIHRGEPDNCKTCPVALVLQENGYPNAEVGECLIALDGKNRRYRIGERLHNWIANFDYQIRVPTIRFTICHRMQLVDITS